MQAEWRRSEEENDLLLVALTDLISGVSAVLAQVQAQLARRGYGYPQSQSGSIQLRERSQQDLESVLDAEVKEAWNRYQAAYRDPADRTPETSIEYFAAKENYHAAKQRRDQFRRMPIPERSLPGNTGAQDGTTERQESALVHPWSWGRLST